MNNLVRFSPNTEMRRLQREVDQLFDSFFPTRSRSENGDTEQAVWAPRVDLAETEDHYMVHVDVPGMKREDLQIRFQDGQLSISGERRAEHTEDDKDFVRVERSFGRFYRSFTLPRRVNEDEIEALYQDGVLTVRVPKAEETKPRRIEVS